MLRKNQELTMICEALGADFEGICRVDGQVVFVRGALPGERLRARVIKATKNYAVARLVQLETFSPGRQTPPCPAYPRCGGCTAQHMRYADTLAHKRRQVADCLARIGGLPDVDVLPVIGMENPWHYRNKGAFPVGGRAGAPVIGMYAARSHDIVDTPQGCLLQTAQANAIVRAVRRWMVDCRVPPYDEGTHGGLVRHVMVREAADGDAMLVLVINGRHVPQEDVLIGYAAEAAPRLRSVVLSANTRRTNVILGDGLRTLWGEDALEDELAGCRMRVSPRSFFQVNRAQAERLYECAIDGAGLTGAERVWDLYCGAGAITLPLARHAAHVTGVEVVSDAVADARESAQVNGVYNVDFVSGAVEALLPALAAKGAPDVVVLDPPRKGCEAEALAAVVAAAPRTVVYVSCSPATLARDLKVLAAGGYAPERVQPVDMFAWTGHVECVAVMGRKGERL